MKILIINRWVGYNQGGAETAVKDTIENFMHENEITLITSIGKNTHFLEKNINVEYIKIPNYYYSYGLMGIFFSIFFAFNSLLKYLKLRFIKKNKFDLVISFFSLDCVTARLIKLIDTTPYVHIMQGTTSLEMIEGNRADKVIAISKFCQDQCKANGFESVKIIKGIYLNRFRHRDRSLDKFSKIPTLLTVCRLEPRKNLETLINAAEILNNKGLKFQIIIVGDGISKKQYIDLTREKNLQNFFDFKGFIPNNDPKLANIYRDSDLFILPTLYECCGYVYLESIASGLPIIASDNSCMPEIVGNCGILFQTENHEDLAKKIESYFKDISLRNYINNEIKIRRNI